MAEKIRVAVSAIQKFYPLELADSSWDNTGLLVDASTVCMNVLKKVSVLLTVDLTSSVADEAIRQKADLIVAYHPFIFKGLKSITPNDPQQNSLIKLISSGISVYSPHTSVDAAVGGVNDWLAEGIAQTNFLSSRVIEPNHQFEGAGMGRVVTLKEPASLSKLVQNVKTSLGLDHVQVAQAASHGEEANVKTIAICAGSGGSVFRGLKADLYYTGELSHHEALHLKEGGSSIIVCNHSNTERGFLTVMKGLLEKEFSHSFDEYEIVVSTSDCDPYSVW